MTTNTAEVMTSGPSHYAKVCQLLLDLGQLRTARKNHDGDSKEYLAVSDEIALVERLVRHHTRLMGHAYQVQADLRGPLNKVALSRQDRRELEALAGSWLQAVQ